MRPYSIFIFVKSIFYPMRMGGGGECTCFHFFRSRICQCRMADEKLDGNFGCFAMVTLKDDYDGNGWRFHIE